MMIWMLVVLLAQADGGVVTGTTHDAWIAGEIEGAYRVDERLDVFDLQVHVEDGVVTLTGELDSELDREAAVHIAEHVDGVVAVRDKLTVRGPESAPPPLPSR